MELGYSKLLIFEYILPDVGAPLFPSLLDIQILGYVERDGEDGDAVEGVVGEFGV
jgi:hypothetical protein